MFWLNGKSIKICSKSSNPLYFFPPSKMNEVVQELFSFLSINYKFLQLLIKKGFNNFNSLVLELLRVLKFQNINLTRFFIFIFFKLRVIGGIKVKVFKRRRKIVKIFFSPQNLNYNLQFRKGLHFFFKGLKLRKEKSIFLKLKSEIYDSLLFKSTLTFFKKKLMYESLVLYKKFSKFIKKKKKNKNYLFKFFKFFFKNKKKTKVYKQTFKFETLSLELQEEFKVWLWGLYGRELLLRSKYWMRLLKKRKHLNFIRGEEVLLKYEKSNV